MPTHCQSSGYRGRIGIFEILQITPRIRELIAAKMPESILRKEAQSSGFKTLAADCLKKVKAGVTTLEEYNRAIFEEEEMARICPSCKEMIKTDYIACPYCGYAIIDSCPSCGRAKERDWNCCPYCRHTFPQNLKIVTEQENSNKPAAVNE
jgi:hypothetical protein